ncbi:winged helix DNA-binding domain-containing protein [Micromonospora sp. DT47]|uniref:winged helix DNA-binding domain-containing protein n=1 Tax=Micromonospora sp. DT47 TaxID=3393431 RepID=UPI003CE82B32
MGGSTGMATMSWTAAVSRRLRRHRLAGPPGDGTPADVAAAICGAHAQVMSAAELSIGLRAAGTTREHVRAALWTERSLVKAFGPRGTVHLLPARDLPMWTAALAAVPRALPSQAPGVRLDPAQTDTVVAAVGAALREEELTLEELDERVAALAGSWAGERVMPAFQGFWPRWRQALPVAAARGQLCFGPPRGRKVTYAHPARWLPGFTPAEPGPAAAELARRWLYAYGPADPQHFAQWLAAPRRWAAELFDTLADELEPVELGGARRWRLVGDDATEEPVEGVRLLPYFDAYTVGCHPRELLFPDRAAARALARGQSGNYPVLLIDGIVGGVWHQRRTGRRIEITVEPLEPLTAARRRALDDQAQRVGEVLEAVPRLTIGPVTVGPHA